MINNKRHIMTEMLSNRLRFNPDELLDYFDKLPEDTQNIYFNSKKIYFVPDLSRFKNLITLSLSGCQLYGLPILPPLLENLYIQKTGLNRLPNLQHNRIEILDAMYNNLIEIPILPDTLRHLHMSHNKILNVEYLPPNLETLNLLNNRITHIKYFPQNLKLIYISNNKLKELPPISSTVEELFVSGNMLILMPEIPTSPTITMQAMSVLCETLGKFYTDNSIVTFEQTIRNINVLQKFRSIYYYAKYRNRLRKWLWERIREPKIKAAYHPDKLKKCLDNVLDDDLEDVFEKWCK